MMVIPMPIMSVPGMLHMIAALRLCVHWHQYPVCSRRVSSSCHNSRHESLGHDGPFVGTKFAASINMHHQSASILQCMLCVMFNRNVVDLLEPGLWYMPRLCLSMSEDILLSSALNSHLHAFLHARDV